MKESWLAVNADDDEKILSFWNFLSMALTISEREKFVENFHEYYPFAPQKSKNWMH